jgi:undecaprenyl diphosphate synthase
MNDYPQHVAIIMDGNGRWAASRNLSRTQGHAEGVKRVEEIVNAARQLNIKVLTLYTFSTENWNRPEHEVNVLMNMLTTILGIKIKKLKNDNIRFQVIGRQEKIPQAVWQMMTQVMEETKENTGLILNLAFNYGSRLEIIDAIKKIATDVRNDKIRIEDINETIVHDALYTKGLPDPDLLIRTSGEKRVSNFLLWQLSYAEFYFTEKFWPDFNEDEFKKALQDYRTRERRFGKVTADQK